MIRLRELYPEDEIEVSLPDNAPALQKTLRLQACEEPEVIAGRSITLGRTSVQVQCRGTLQWSFYRPAEISAKTDALTSSRTLPRGSVLTPGDVRRTRIDRASLRDGWYAEEAQVEGLALARNLRAGDVIYAQQLRRPHAIHRGDKVMIKAQGARLAITSEGEALEAGHPGDQIRVRNMHSRRVLSLWVWDKGLVGTRPQRP